VKKEGNYTRVWCAHNSSILVGEYIVIRSKPLLSVKTAASRAMVDSIIHTHWWMARERMSPKVGFEFYSLPRSILIEIWADSKFQNEYLNSISYCSS